MIDMNEVHAATDTLARAFEEYKSVNDQRLADVDRRGSADVVLTDKLGRMDQALGKLQDDVSSVKTVLRRPAKGAASFALNDEGDADAESDAYPFEHWIPPSARARKTIS